LLDEPLKTIGFEENTDNYFIECLKQEIVKWACMLNHFMSNSGLS